MPPCTARRRPTQSGSAHAGLYPKRYVCGDGRALWCVSKAGAGVVCVTHKEIAGKGIVLFGSLLCGKMPARKGVAAIMRVCALFYVCVWCRCAPLIVASSSQQS
jgi:hypothetical protein